MKRRLAAGVWISGFPLRVMLVWMIRGYRGTIGRFVGGRCRFYPSCSEYAERAIAHTGFVRGVGLTVWRVLRCSPLSKGGVDHPPRGRPGVYEGVIRPGRVPVAPKRAPAWSR
jgi:putative membrane protein insertion efficiency factor